MQTLVMLGRSKPGYVTSETTIHKVFMIIMENNKISFKVMQRMKKNIESIEKIVNNQKCLRKIKSLKIINLRIFMQIAELGIEQEEGKEKRGYVEELMKIAQEITIHLLTIEKQTNLHLVLNPLVDQQTKQFHNYFKHLISSMATN